MRSRPAICGFSSILIFTSFTAPLAAATWRSSTGVSCLHGPHHGAQKSTMTGWFIDSWITSAAKPRSVVSLISGAAVSAGASVGSDISNSKRAEVLKPTI